MATRDKNIGNSDKLHDVIKEIMAEHDNEINDPYIQSFLFINPNDDADYKSKKFKRETILKKLMNEKVNIKTKSREMEKEVSIKAKENQIIQDKYKESVLQNIYDTFSPVVEQKTIDRDTNGDNKSIFTFCHNYFLNLK